VFFVGLVVCGGLGWGVGGLFGVGVGGVWGGGGGRSVGLDLLIQS